MTGDNAAGLPNLDRKRLLRKCLIRQWFSALQKIEVALRAEGALPDIGHVAGGLASGDHSIARKPNNLN